MEKIVIEWNNEGKIISNFCYELFKNKTITFIKKKINKGDIRVNKKKVKDNYILKNGDLLNIYFSVPKEKNDSFKKCNIKIDIFFEDENIIVFYKNKGIYSQEDKNNKIDTVNNYLKLYLFNKKEWDGLDKEKEPALINRIDVNTEGLLIAGKNKKNVRNLNNLIANKKITKKYIAVVHGRLKNLENYWTDYIYNHPTTPNKMKVSPSKNSYSTSIIETNVFVIDVYRTYSLVEVELVSGKKHQIRAHLSYYKNPIVGDYKYANKKYISNIKNQILISNEIKFNIEKNNELNYLNKIKLRKYDPKKINIEDLIKKYTI